MAMSNLPSVIVREHSSYNHLSNAVGQQKTPVLSSRFRTFLPGLSSSQSKLLDSGFPMTRARSMNALSIVRARRPDGYGESPETVDISVFRFTLGIPGFSDSDLPRVLGFVFGGLLILNHAFGLKSLTAAQLRSEGVGLVLAAVSISLPYIGRQLNGTKISQGQVLGAGQKQIFFLADGLSEGQRQDLAWASYNLLRNTSTTAVLVWHSGQVVGARGYWDPPTDSDPGTSHLEWLKQKLDTKLSDFLSLKERLYLPDNAGTQGWDIIPRGAASVLVQPFPLDLVVGKDIANQGFLLLVSNTPRGYRRKDRDWTASLAKKLSIILLK